MIVECEKPLMILLEKVMLDTQREVSEVKWAYPRYTKPWYKLLQRAPEALAALAIR